MMLIWESKGRWHCFGLVAGVIDCGSLETAIDVWTQVCSARMMSNA